MPKPRQLTFSDHSYRWRIHFEQNLDHMGHVPWDQDIALTDQERMTIAESIATFQLGENAEGKSFRRAGQLYVDRTGDQHYLPALKHFIEEEQRHSKVLGRFMDQQAIPRKEREWTDSTFRFVRKLAGLNVCITVLVTAEIIAAVYYRALGNATKSPVLRAICGQILVDESHHLTFQAATLAKDRSDWPIWKRWLFEQFHRCFLLGTIAVVWWEHRSVFRAGGFRFLRMASATWSTLEGVLQKIRRNLDTGQFSTPAETEITRYTHLPSHQARPTSTFIPAN